MTAIYDEARLRKSAQRRALADAEKRRAVEAFHRRNPNASVEQGVEFLQGESDDLRHIDDADRICRDRARNSIIGGASLFYGFLWGAEDDCSWAESLLENEELWEDKHPSIELGFHCCAQHLYPIVGVRGLVFMALPQQPIVIPEVFDHQMKSARNELTDFCSHHSITPPQERPQWWLEYTTQG